MESKLEKLKALRRKAEKNGDERLKDSLDNKIKILSNAKTVTK